MALPPVQKTTPLDWRTKIVNPDGTPNNYFIRLWQTVYGNGDNVQAEIDALEAAQLQAGLGISITPDGHLLSDPTIALDATLDDLTDVNLSTPPTDGQALIYDSSTSKWIADDVAGGLEIDQGGTPVVTTATVLNFTGSGITVTDAGGGQADIDIPGGGSPAALTYWVVHDTGTGSSQNVTLPYSVSSEEEIDVYVNGIHYETTEYSVSGTTLALTTNASGDAIEVRGEIISGSGGGGGGNWWFDPPAAASFTLQSGDATNLILTDDADVGLLVQGNTPVTGDRQRQAYRTLTDKTLDWDMRMRFNWSLASNNYSNMGLLMHDSVGGRTVAWNVSAAGSDIFARIRWNSLAGGFNSESTVTVRGYANWLRVDRVGANMNFYWSSDGKLWHLYLTEAVTSWLANAPDRVGLNVTYNRTGVTSEYSVDNFSLTGPAI